MSTPPWAEFPAHNKANPKIVSLGLKGRERELAIAGKDQLTKLIQAYKCIHPFDYALMDGDGYVLTVRDETTLHYLEHRNVISYEVVFTPPTYVSHLTAKSRYGRMGLSFLNAAKVHSGFVGRLALELVNLSNGRQPITIKRGDPLMHVEFISREGNPAPYKGDYMFQYMSDDEVSLYMGILKERFKGLFDLVELEKMARERFRG
jgi:dCTP deaminase